MPQPLPAKGLLAERNGPWGLPGEGGWIFCKHQVMELTSVLHGEDQV